jgi:hypothetical protein
MVHFVLFFFIHFRAPSSTEIHVARSLRNVVIGGQCTVCGAIFDVVHVNCDCCSFRPQRQQVGL